MKKISFLAFILLFVVGILMICTSDTGFVGTSFSANLAGGIIAFFSGIWLTISVYFYLKKE